MTHTAILLVTCKPNQIESTKKSLNSLPDVTTVTAVKGAYDIIVKITTSSVNHLKEIVSTKIRNHSTVRSALILNVLQ